jgi:hypothetical protein
VHQSDSLGLQLVDMLSEQLEGTLTVARQGGTSFTLTFPLPDAHSGGLGAAGTAANGGESLLTEVVTATDRPGGRAA